MIIVNNNADYSACSIGKAHVITEKLRNILLGYGITDFTSTRAVALMNLYWTLEDNRILEGLEFLYLPIMANNILQSFMDLKSGQTRLPSYSTPSTLAENQLGLKFQDGAIYGVDGFTFNLQTAAIWNLPDAGITTRNAFLFAAFDGVESSKDLFGMSGNGGYPIFCTHRFYDGDSSIVYLDNGNQNTLSVADFSYYQTDVNHVVNVQTTNSSVNESYQTEKNISAIYPFYRYWGGTTTNSTVGMKIYGIGKNLRLKGAIVKEAIQTFLSAIS